MTTDAERIAAAIAEHHPQEIANAGELAIDIDAAAEARGLPTAAAIAYVADRPRQQLSASAFLRWCDKYKIVATGKEKPDGN